MGVDERAAAVCGLFCGTCPSYNPSASKGIFGRKGCGGCLSTKCSCDCIYDFRNCAKSHNATRCYECEKFPCEKIEDFSHKHIENGICHHENVIIDLYKMKDIGVAEWITEQVRENTCIKCGKLILWKEKKIHKCEK